MNSERTALSGFAFRILSWFCPEHLYEEIEGDLVQRFERDAKVFGKRKAEGKLLWSVIKFFRPGILLRNRFLMRFNQSYMFSSYLKIMRRNLVRHKFHSAINVIGLTVGITFALLIGVFIRGELQVNKSLKEVDRLYLLENKYTGSADNFAFFSPAALSTEAMEEYPAVFENYYRFWDRNVTVSKDDKHFRIQTMIGDSTFARMFGFPVLFGDVTSALSDPYSLVISEKIARQFFNRADVIGESLVLHAELGGLREFIVKAVIADPEEKNSVSDFMNSDAQMFIPLDNSDLFISDDATLWVTDIITYIKLRPQATEEQATKALNALLKANMPEDVSRKRSIQLDPLEDYYLVTNNGSVRSLIISLAVIVAFILLLAVANFINITIAGSFSRLKEVGVRKVIGGVRRQVIIQFLSESMVLAILSGIISLVFYELLHNYFSEVLNAPLPSVTQFGFVIWKWIVLGIIITGLLAGLYPSVYLSATGTIESLKGKFRSVNSTIQLSRILMSAQFLVAIFILVAALIMSNQVSFFLEKDLGYDKSFVLNVTSAPRLWTVEGFTKIESTKKEFLALPEIMGVTISWGAPAGTLTPRDFRIYRPGQAAEDGILTSIGSADEDYASVYGMTVLDGKFLFGTGESYTPRSIVLNEAAQKSLGAKVGDKLQVQFFTPGEFTLVGIVKNFNFETLHNSIKPVAFLHNRDFGAFRHFSFKVAPGNLSSSVDAIESKWKQVFPNDPFVYQFVDEELKERYKTELQLKKASGIASVLIIIIVLTGVLGLVSLNVNKKTKEIGIRKVLGASVSDILMLLSREYAFLMIGSFTVGFPLTFFFITHWLQGFAYHIELSWWMFVAPMALLFCVTILIVTAQSMKAAVSDPVKAIKCD